MSWLKEIYYNFVIKLKHRSVVKNAKKRKPFIYL